MTDRIVRLPCGTAAKIEPFNGISQKHLQKIAEALAEKKRVPDGDVETDVLRQCVVSLDGRPADEASLLRLRMGSRLRALTEARILTYGPSLDLYHVCPCRKDDATPDKIPLDLATLADVPYPAADTFTLQVASRAGRRVELTLRWATGRHQNDYQRLVARNLVGLGDLALVQVTHIDGQAHGIADVMLLPGDVLDAVREVVDFMVPRHFLPPPTEKDPPRSERWWARVTSILDEMQTVVTWAGKPEAAPAGPEAAPDATPAPPPRPFPLGGFPTMVQVACPHCDRVGWENVYLAPDFFFRRAARRLDF
mgnify:CR=1 FL=1